MKSGSLQFDADHKLPIKAMIGGINIMLGYYPSKRETSTMEITYRWGDKIVLRYWIGGTIAGKRLVQYKDLDNNTAKLLREWAKN